MGIYLGRTKNNLKIEKWRRINKIVKINEFSVSVRIIKDNIISNGRNIVWIIFFKIITVNWEER
jgi:hypothetical protein